MLQESKQKVNLLSDRHHNLSCNLEKHALVNFHPSDSCSFDLL